MLHIGLIHSRCNCHQQKMDAYTLSGGAVHRHDSQASAKAVHAQEHAGRRHSCRGVRKSPALCVVILISRIVMLALQSSICVGGILRQLVRASCLLASCLLLLSAHLAGAVGRGFVPLRYGRSVTKAPNRRLTKRVL
jgi:hypothetical protein